MTSWKQAVKHRHFSVYFSVTGHLNSFVLGKKALAIIVFYLRSGYVHRIKKIKLCGKHTERALFLGLLMYVVFPGSSQ